MTNLVVYLLRPGEDEASWQSLLDLWAVVFPATWGDKNLAFLKQWWRQQPDLQGFLGRDAEGTVITGASMYPMYHDFDHYDEVKLRFLCDLAVAPQHQRQGWGSRFFSYVLKLDPRPLWLTCRPELVPFYERCWPPRHRSAVHPETGLLALVFQLHPLENDQADDSADSVT